MKQLIVFAFFATVFFSCNSGTAEKKGKNNVPLTLRFQQEEFRGNEQIYEGDSLFSEMSFRYPVFVGGIEITTKKINEYIFSLTQSIGFEEMDSTKSETKSLRKIADHFFWEAKESANPDFPHSNSWSYNFSTDTLMLDQKQQILTLIHAYDSYTGGAHPNHFTQISTIDLSTGDTLSYNSLFGNNTELLNAVEKRFVENEKKILSENGYEFNMADYWFEEGFKFPQAMGITREGIRCIYSPYEVASYARGTIDFTVPYADIPNFKLKK